MNAASPTRYSLRTLFLLTTLACAALAGVVSLFRASHREQVRRACQLRLQLIARALENYNETWGQYPRAITYADDGRPMHSWRVLIHPFLAQSSSFFDRYDRSEPWDGPQNRLLGDAIPDTWRHPNGADWVAIDYPEEYRCPEAPASQNRMLTNYVMVIDDRPGRPKGPLRLPGAEPLERSSLSELMILEIAPTDIHWLEPRDVLVSDLLRERRARRKGRSAGLVGASTHGGACVLRGDVIAIWDAAGVDAWLDRMMADDKRSESASDQAVDKGGTRHGAGRAQAAGRGPATDRSR